MNQEIEITILDALRREPAGLSSAQVVELVNTYFGVEKITGGEARRTLFGLREKGQVYNDKRNVWHAVDSVIPDTFDNEPTDETTDFIPLLQDDFEVPQASELELNRILAIASANGFTLSAQQEFLARQASYSAVPGGLNSKVRQFLKAKYEHGLWSHQSLALDLVLSNRNVALVTPTASGKTLVFTAAAAHLIKSAEERVKVLALYPQKALIADQLKKWQAFSDSLKFSIGHIDGNVPVSEREQILKSSDVVLMTPDVAHAWLLSNLKSREIQRFLFSLRLLILDEAHVYQGIFGTNMAFFLRRLQCCTNSIRIICSTATVADDRIFLKRLIGRNFEIIDGKSDGSPAPGRILSLLSENADASFPAFLAELSELPELRFLAFCDSRKGVEQYGHLTEREQLRRDSLRNDSDYYGSDSRLVLPYRAGYEAVDRSAIQAALTNGELAGVISTSALEVGIDIGELDLVILYGVPPDSKSFWQRFGRVGRSKPGYCLLVDGRNVIYPTESGLVKFIQNPIESNWLYFDNKYMQFAHAVCAEKEFAALSRSKCMREDKLKRRYELAFGTIAPRFTDYMDKTTTSDTDFSELSKRLTRDPHHVLTLRTGIEQNYEVIDQSGRELGDLTYSQMLREAYPGAVYYYMAKPYRVTSVDLKAQKVFTRKEAPFISTKPIEDSFVFPELNKEIYSYHAGILSSAAEMNVTALERVYGFTEGDEQTLYDANCEYAAGPLTRRFKTTGVCLHAESVSVEEWLLVAESILASYCNLFSIHPAELGYGTFKNCTSPIDSVSVISGLCIYDSVMGGLRLTQRLAARISEVLMLASEQSKKLETSAEQAILFQQTQAIMTRLRNCFADITSRPLVQQNRIEVKEDLNIRNQQESLINSNADNTASTTQVFDLGTCASIDVIAVGEMARYQLNFKRETVKISSFKLRTDGLHYGFFYPDKSVFTWAPADRITPISKSTKIERLDLIVEAIE
jgi:DEAD/DEAH box helicase domain-containing protein